MKLTRSIKLLVLLASGVFLFSCAYKANKKTGITDPALTRVATFEIKDTHVEIIPPTAGIPGKAPEVDLPGTQDWWKGVFVAGRNPVKISPYAIYKTEVTYKLWKEVHDWATGDEEGEGKPAEKYNFYAGWKGSKNSDDPKISHKLEPVTMISWNDAIVFCNAYTEMKNGNLDEAVYWDKDPKTNSDAKVLKDASKISDLDTTHMDKSKIGFRLPTEAEWELAARLQTNGSLSPLNRLSGATKPVGFSGLTLPDGETWESLYQEAKRVAVFDEYWNGSTWVEQISATSKTAVVKSKAANALGLYDISGNAWEWCFDYYNSDAKFADAEQNPVVDPAGPSTGSYRIVRVGSWRDGRALSLLVGIRNTYRAGTVSNFLGLRLARSLPKE